MKESAKNQQSWLVIPICGAAAAILTVLLSMVCSALILKDLLPEGQIGSFTSLICAISVLFACMVGTTRSSVKSIGVCLAIGTVYFAILLLAKAIAFPGAASGMLIRAAVVFASAILAWILLQIRKEGRGSRRRRGLR